MNAEQIAKLKEVALRAPKNPGEWPFYLRSFQAAASPEVVLELIALAERALLAAAPAPIQQDDEDKKAINDMLAYGTGFTVGGRHVPTETVRMFSNPKITSAESSKQMQQPAQLAVTTHANAHSTTVVIKLVQGNKATGIYCADHSANGETIGVSDLPDSLFSASKAIPEPCGGCGETDPDKRCIGCGHTFSGTPPALAGSQVQAAGDAAQCTLGVGSGNGNLFVVGDYDSIKAAQAWILRAEKAESRLAEIQRGVEVTPELLRHLQLHTELGAHACADLAGGYSLITEIIEAAFKFRQREGQVADSDETTVTVTIRADGSIRLVKTDSALEPNMSPFVQKLLDVLQDQGTKSDTSGLPG